QPATLAAESRFVAAQHERFRDLTGKLLVGELGSTPFLDWVWRRAGERAAVQGACLSWSEFEREHPSLALAALRLYSSLEHRLPEGARLAERHRLAPTADDWVALIDDYCRHCLLPSADQADHAAWQQLRRALLSLGYVLTARGARAYVSPVDRVLALSASKGLVAVEILAAERDALGDHPRALVLCDYEKAGSDVLAKLRGPAIAHAANGASRGRAGADPGHGAHRGLLPRHCHRPHRLAGRTGAGTAGTRSPRPPIAIGAGTQSPRPPIAIGAGTRCASARSSRRDRMAGRPAGRTWSSCVPPTPPGNRAATCPRSLVISKRATAAVW
ncbi:MAG: hypothetical protein M1401_12685, partial [Chloroflexi bacterium]|nr:hypothetical protein [Chloroflexota bacterium]